MKNFEYRFVKLDVKIHAFKGVYPKEDYHQIIEEHARDEWRLVQIFAPPIKGYGMAGFYELIFEREIRSPATHQIIS
jgi:hypothetical protein